MINDQDKSLKQEQPDKTSADVKSYYERFMKSDLEAFLQSQPPSPNSELIFQLDNDTVAELDSTFTGSPNYFGIPQPEVIIAKRYEENNYSFFKDCRRTHPRPGTAEKFSTSFVQKVKLSAIDPEKQTKYLTQQNSSSKSANTDEEFNNVAFNDLTWDAQKEYVFTQKYHSNRTLEEFHFGNHGQGPGNSAWCGEGIIFALLPKLCNMTPVKPTTAIASKESAADTLDCFIYGSTNQVNIVGEDLAPACQEPIFITTLNSKCKLNPDNSVTETTRMNFSLNPNTSPFILRNILSGLHTPHNNPEFAKIQNKLKFKHDITFIRDIDSLWEGSSGNEKLTLNAYNQFIKLPLFYQRFVLELVSPLAQVYSLQNDKYYDQVTQHYSLLKAIKEYLVLKPYLKKEAIKIEQPPGVSNANPPIELTIDFKKIDTLRDFDKIISLLQELPYAEITIYNANNKAEPFLKTLLNSDSLTKLYIVSSKLSPGFYSNSILNLKKLTHLQISDSEITSLTLQGDNLLELGITNCDKLNKLILTHTCSKLNFLTISQNKKLETLHLLNLNKDSKQSLLNNIETIISNTPIKNLTINIPDNSFKIMMAIFSNPNIKTIDFVNQDAEIFSLLQNLQPQEKNKIFNSIFTNKIVINPKSLLGVFKQIETDNSHYHNKLFRMAITGKSHADKHLLTDKDQEAINYYFNYTYLLTKDNDLTHPDSDLFKENIRIGNTALHLAAQNNNLVIVKQLVSKMQECGLPLDSKNDKGQTAWDLAIKNDHAQIATIIRKAQQDYYNKILFNIVINGQLENGLPKLLDQKEDNNKIDEILKNTNLLTPDKDLPLSANELFKNKRINNTPLHFAAQNGNLFIVKKLLTKMRLDGLPIDTKNDEGKTAQELASSRFYTDVAQEISNAEKAQQSVNPNSNWNVKVDNSKTAPSMEKSSQSTEQDKKPTLSILNSRFF